MLASAGVLFQLALLPQSRGWLIVAPMALLVYFVLVPERVRTLIVLLPLIAVAGLTAPSMLDVFDAAGKPGALAPALDQARDTMLLGAGALFLAGALIGLADRSMTLSDRTTRLGKWAVGAIAWASALAGLIVVISIIGNPFSWAGDRWDDIKSGEAEFQPEGARLGTGLGSNRYDFWRVSLDEFEDAPLAGVGSENFAGDYVRERDSDEEPLHPHSLPLRILAQVGLVGAVLFLGFLACALVGLGRVRLRSEVPLSRGLAGVVAVVLFYWLVHSTGDWFWAFPALCAPVFAWLGLGMRIDGDRRTSSSPAWVLPAGVAAGAAALLAAVSLLLPWRAAVDIDEASNVWRRDPEVAFDRLDRARGLNFLSARPDLVEGAIASRLGDRARMRTAFERALDRYPESWYATLELAALDAVEGDRRSALRRLREVENLNPREEMTAVVRRGIVRGRPVSLAMLDAVFLERVCSRLGRSPAPGGCEAR